MKLIYLLSVLVFIFISPCDAKDMLDSVDIKKKALITIVYHEFNNLENKLFSRLILYLDKPFRVLNSEGFNSSYFFFSIPIKGGFDTISYVEAGEIKKEVIFFNNCFDYIFAYNKVTGVLFCLNGFKINDFKYFIAELSMLNKNLDENYYINGLGFISRRIIKWFFLSNFKVENLDIECLYNYFYINSQYINPECLTPKLLFDGNSY